MTSTNYLRLHVFLAFSFFITVIALKAQNSDTYEMVYQEPGTENSNDLIIDSDGNYVIVGHTTSFNVGWSGIYLVKIAPDGNMIWNKAHGGSGNEYGYSVVQDNSGNYIVAGSTTSSGAGEEDAYLVKYDNNGNVLWEKVYGGSGTEEIRTVRITSDGGFILAGYTNSFGAGFFDMYLIRTNSSGDTLWTKTFGANGFDNARSLQIAPDGGFLVCGQKYDGSNAQFWLVKTDSNGNLEWEKTYGDSGDDEGKYVYLTGDNGYIMVGDYDIYGANNSDVMVLKTDQNGDSLWSKIYGGDEKDVGKTIMEAPDGGYIVGAITRSYGLGVPYVWVIKLDQAGGIEWENKFGSEKHDHCHIARPAPGGGYLAAGHTNMIEGSEEDLYLLKMDEFGNIDSMFTPPQDTTTVAKFAVDQRDLRLYPNPSNGVFNMKLDQSGEPYRLIISNFTGQIVYDQNLDRRQSNNQLIDLSHLAKGSYLLEVSTPNHKNTRMIVIN